MDHGPEAELIIISKEVDLGLYPFACPFDRCRQLRIQMLHRVDVAIDSEQRLGVLQPHRPDGQPGGRDRKSNRHAHSFSARAAPLEAGVVVTLRETRYLLDCSLCLRGAFRSAFLRSPAGAYRRSQRVVSLLARRPWKLVSSSLFAKRGICWIARSACGARFAQRSSDHQR